MKESQNQMVLRYMKDFGSITTLQAFTDLGVTRLASRICDLRKEHVIASEKTSAKNRYGKKVSFKKYWLEE